MFFRKYIKRRKSSKEFLKKLQKDIEDPDIYTPGKPALNSDGTIKFYKEYWFIDGSNSKTLPWGQDKKWNRIIRINNLNK